MAGARIICLLVLCGLCVAVLSACESSIEKFPTAWATLKDSDRASCPDISGQYRPWQDRPGRSLYDIFKVKLKTLPIRNPDKIGLHLKSIKELDVTLYNEGQISLEEKLHIGSDYWCVDGFVAIRYEEVSGVSLGYGVIGFGFDTYYFGKTTKNELVARQVIRGTPILLVIPMPGGKHTVRWHKWQPVDQG